MSNQQVRVQIPAAPSSFYDDKTGFEAKRVKPGKGAKFRCEVATLVAQVDEASKHLPKWQMERLKSILHRNYTRRFKKVREPKYGSLNKGFTELELQHFLRNIKNDKFELLFKYQAHLGLRVGEVCKLHITNIDFDKRELTIKSEKSAKVDSLIIPPDLFQETVQFLSRNTSKISAAGGFIFFKDNDNNNNGLPHADVNYVRKVFRDAIVLSGLDQTYDYTDETVETRKPRRLHRLTTHSLRHYAITRFSKATNGNIVLTSRYARHANPTTTMRYISKDNEELYKSIDFIFSGHKALRALASR